MLLSEALVKYKNAEFNYGDIDCCLFVANVLRDTTGKDFAAPWRNFYKNEFGALRIIAGHGSLMALACSAFGRIHPIAEARSGDPVLIGPPLVARDSIAQGLGICNGTSVSYLTEDGLADASILLGLGCWHV